MSSSEVVQYMSTYYNTTNPVHRYVRILTTKTQFVYGQKDFIVLIYLAYIYLWQGYRQHIWKEYKLKI